MTRYLLDTHGLLWWWTDAERLGSAARRCLAAPDTQIIVSAASVWEIAIKTHAGKLDAIEDFQRDYPLLMARDGFANMPMRDDHVVRAGFLPGAHRDPFDRVLAAQALIEDLTVVTRDRCFAAFGCKVLW